ncbi:helix-turn-helix domain-containing protein [Mesorhizobium sp. YIM 152430]|uniref:helix-turn-helix transcriptional regulator n=1 Tax=Mesorhizobium sp. YIM 152430 TaxID=3031761 RepID=UPI0023DB2175|nr:helix-turn-helix domain-containing protein [Mesorhizobium sp. YIM 152430]MDF1600370.1 helix-turn-helix domain-containing protein [Mesorhizobium sp. YIM 152430]
MTIDLEALNQLELMTPREAAIYLRSSTSTLAKYRMSGRGPKFIRHSNRKTLYRRADLDAWLQAATCSNTGQAA